MFESAAGLAVLGAHKPCFIPARQQHRHNHGWTVSCVQLSQQTQNELQADTSLFHDPTHKPTVLTEYVGLTDSQGLVRARLGLGLESSADRETCLCNAEKTNKSICLSQGIKQE